MNKRRSIIVLVVLLISLLVGVFKWTHDQTKPLGTPQQANPPKENPSAKAPAIQTDTTPQDIVIPDVPGHKLSDQDKSNIAKIVQVFNASIDFWGKVIDQDGNPVVGAAVHYSAADKYFKDGTKYEGTSDERGLFSISNIKGAGLYVRVSKDGYYHIDEKSARSFGYGSPSGEAPPSKQQPAILVLQKMGETEPLIKLETGGVLVPKDGTPKKLSLRRERARLSGSLSGDLQVELWSDYQQPPVFQKSYDWRCRISVPGGGLRERSGEFNFEAPTENYIETFEYKMPATTERWQPSMKKEFFLRLADGCYARVNLNVISGGDIFVTLESYLNPVPGRRNLEFDPAKVIKPAP
jgi:flagellar basal body-associated protein FliL